MGFLTPLEDRVADRLTECLRHLVAQGATVGMVRRAAPRVWFEVVKRAAMEDMILARHESEQAERAAFDRLTKVADDVARRFALQEAELLRADLIAQGRTEVEADEAATAARGSFYLDFFEQFTSELQAELNRTRH